MAILFFTGYLSSGIKDTSLKENVKTKVIRQEANLGDAKVPIDIADQNKREVVHLCKEGFIKTYTKVMRIIAALAFAVKLMALYLSAIRKLKIKMENS